VTNGCREERNWVISAEDVDLVAAKDQDGHGAILVSLGFPLDDCDELYTEPINRTSPEST
jgi:hypothetical protein